MRYEIPFVGFLVLLTAGQAFADPPKDSLNDPYADVPAVPRRPVSEKQRLSLVEKGKGLTRDGHYPEALAAFREALEARPDPKVLLWMGYAQEQTGTLLEAKASYLEAKSVAHASKLTGEEGNAEQALLDIAAKIPRIKEVQGRPDHGDMPAALAGVRYLCRPSPQITGAEHPPRRGRVTLEFVALEHLLG